MVISTVRTGKTKMVAYDERVLCIYLIRPEHGPLLCDFA